MLILGNRIPYEYFITKGKGESDAGSKFLPYETGSYDAALHDAGIQNANVIEYTSVMPTESREISKEEGLKRMQWGEVMECIKAQANGEKGSTISSAVMITTIHDPNGTLVNFGFIGLEDYTKHRDEKRRDSYLKRSAGIKGKWKENPYSPNMISRRLLWNAEI